MSKQEFYVQVAKIKQEAIVVGIMADNRADAMRKLAREMAKINRVCTFDVVDETYDFRFVEPDFTHPSEVKPDYTID